MTRVPRERFSSVYGAFQRAICPNLHHNATSAAWIVAAALILYGVVRLADGASLGTDVAPACWGREGR